MTCWKNFLGTTEKWIRISHDKRAIRVWDIKVELYLNRGKPKAWSVRADYRWRWQIGERCHIEISISCCLFLVSVRNSNEMLRKHNDRMSEIRASNIIPPSTNETRLLWLQEMRKTLCKTFHYHNVTVHDMQTDASRDVKRWQTDQPTKPNNLIRDFFLYVIKHLYLAVTLSWRCWLSRQKPLK